LFYPHYMTSTFFLGRLERILGGFGARDGDELSCLELGVWKITLY